MLKHYVEYLIPGIIVNTASVEEIAERDANKVQVSEICCGFRFFDRTNTGEKKNISGWYYQGKKLTLEEIKTYYGNDNKYSTLISNMEKNKITTVVQTKFGKFLPFYKEDSII